LVGNDVGFWPLDKIVHSNQHVSVSLVAPQKGPCYSVTILSNGAPTFYLYIWPWFPVSAPRLTALVSYWWHHLSTSFLAWSQ
jgi:hypothetical protein